MRGGHVSGDRVIFIGDAMAAVVQGVIEVCSLIDQSPVIVGGLAVLARLSNPHRATVDLDVVDRLRGVPHLEVLRAAKGAQPIAPSGVILPTDFGAVTIDVLEVRQAELDRPSDDPGDRLHAAAHAWANDTATPLTIRVHHSSDKQIEATTLVAEPGPISAMKLQAVMNRSSAKQGTDLLDILRLTFDGATRDTALAQIASIDTAIAADITLHVDLWFAKNRQQSLRWIHAVGGGEFTADDLDLAWELLRSASAR